MTNIKAFVAAAAITAGAAVPLYYADAAGRTERVAADLEKRTATVAWTWTDMTDHAVRLSLTRNGEDFPTAGWGGTLFIGDGALGCAVAGEARGYNELLFDVGRDSVPTNGKYAVQILATNTAGRVEEWARGSLTVRANPAADGMPTNWSAYADIARKVAPYIDATGILSDPSNAYALWDAVSNRTDALIQAVSPKPDFSTDNVELTNTIAQVAPAPGDYESVSNRAMKISLPSDEGHPPYIYEPLFKGTAERANSVSELMMLQSPWALAIYNERWGMKYGFPATGYEYRPFAYVSEVEDIATDAKSYTDAATNGFLRTSGGAMTGDLTLFGDLKFYYAGALDGPVIYAQTPGALRFGSAYPSYANRYAILDLERLSEYDNAEIAFLSDIPDQDLSEYAKQYAVNALSNRVEEISAIVNTWETYWSGTNVMFEVTNYYGNTTGELPRLRIRELRDGAWTNVWDEAHKFDVCRDEILGEVARSNATVLAKVSNDYAPKAWGAYTDKGGTNVVGNSVWMTSPETYFAGGTEYQRVAVGAGAVCVLTENGAAAYTAGEAGTFRFQDEGGTNYFGFAKSDSYTIGCRTDGITVEGNLVTLRYDVIMGGTDVPIVYWRLALDAGDWTQLNNADGTACAGAPYTVTWYTSGGSYYAAINCGSNASGFFKAETSVAGDVVFETNMKACLDGGIECRNTQTGVMGVIRPTYNGSTVNWSWSAR